MGFNKIWIFVFLIGLSGTVFAADNVNVIFTVGGCSFTYDSTDYGVAKGYCGDGGYYGDASGMFFCEDNGAGVSPTPWYTLNQVGRGCSMGVDYPNFDISSMPQCCPSGFHCAADDDNTGYICVQNTEKCEDQGTEGACEGLGYGCFWTGVQCVGDVSDLGGCEYYKTETNCTNDDFGLSDSGPGSELIGTEIECDGKIFTLSADDSSCTWNGTACHNNRTYVQSYNPSGDSTSFSCTSVYSLGDCNNGVQNVDWSASWNSGGISDECLAASGCADGSDTRFCGEPPIKLPGFGIFSFALSLLLIGSFYFYSQRKESFK